MDLADYRRIARAIAWIEEHRDEQPTLDDVARACRTSPYHFQRMFRRFAGVSPKRFLQVLTVEDAKRALLEGKSALEATFEAGLSSPGRLHDLFVTLEAQSPGEFARLGRGLVVRHGVADSPFGPALVASTSRGICHLSFVDHARSARAELHARFPEATLVEDDEAATRAAERIFGRRRGGIALHVEGTNFQVQVWRALLAIPDGAVAAYEDVARALDRPSSTRAVASAIARNDVAFLIPCHRVLRNTGALGGYRWGTARKATILAWERGRAEARS